MCKLLQRLPHVRPELLPSPRRLLLRQSDAGRGRTCQHTQRACVSQCAHVCQSEVRINNFSLKATE